MSNDVADNNVAAMPRPDGREEPPVPDFGQWIHATLAIIEYPATQNGAFCPEWWNHPEAVARFRALYQEYLVAAEKGGISDWWVHHWDLHARALFDPQTGVFRDCSAGHRPAESRRVRNVSADELQMEGFDDVGDVVNPYWY